ncbi:MAG: 4Fe-4S binding protein [Actinomycetota bacterium]
MIHIPERCTACLNCQLVCSLFHDGECAPSLSRIVLSVQGSERRAEFTDDCDECARCAKFCPYGAMEKGK